MLRIARQAAVFAVGILVSLVVAVPAVAVVTPEHVLGEKGTDEGLGYVNDQNITWMGNSKAHPKHYDAFAELLTGGSRVRLNAPGTEGYPGGFDPGTNTVIYQQAAQRSDIYFYNLDTQERARVPDVNNRSWEWGPEISTGYILFAREFKRNGTWHNSLLLYNRGTQHTKTIDTWGPNPYTPTGGVGDSYASWAVCTKTCRAYVYDIAAGTTRKIPTVNGRWQYSPVVDEVNGEVYFVRSGAKCGANVGIWRLPIAEFGAIPTEIVDLPDRIDTSGVLSLTSNASVVGSQDIYFDRWSCRRDESDVYAARDVTSLPDATAAMPTSTDVPRSTFEKVDDPRLRLERSRTDTER